MTAGLTVSVFSAPNYCGRGNNLGSIMRFNDSSLQPCLMQFRHYSAL